MSSQESASHVNVRQRGSRKHASNGSTPAVAPIEPPAEPTNEQPQASSSSSPSQQYKVFLSPNGLNLGEVVDPRAEFVGAIDQGTSSTRFVLFDRQGRIVRAAQQELPQIHTTGKPGWAEHDPMAIMDSIHACINMVLTSSPPISGSQIIALGLTNQRETSVMWDSVTGRPLHNALVWHDTRTADVVADMSAKMAGGKEHFRASCGLPLSTYFSATKLKWLLHNVPQVAEAVKNGRARAGTIDSWIIWNLTGGANSNTSVHVTDVTNASRTMLMSLESLEWSEDNCQAFDIPMDILPKIRSSSEVYGHVFSGPLKGVRIAGCVGDQQAAMLGQLCLKPGQAKSTYGTGSFLLLNTGSKAVPSTHGLLTTVCYKLGSSPAVYALEGSVSVAGSGVQWLRDQMKVIDKASDVDTLAGEVADTCDTYFVPAFSGLLSPHWKQDARGVWAGLTHASNRAHLARAVLHASAYQTREVLDAMTADTAQSDSGVVHLTSLKVDGGMCASNILMQFQADQLAIPVVRPASLEATASGAAFCAGLAVGFWTGTAQLLELADQHRDVRVFEPSMAPSQRAELFRGWKKAVQRTFAWVESETLTTPSPSPGAEAAINKAASAVAAAKHTATVATATAAAHTFKAGVSTGPLLGTPHSVSGAAGAAGAAARRARISPVLSHLAVLGVGVLVGCGVAAAYLRGAKTTARH